MNPKGQAAIEYLMVFGLALLLSTPFMLRAQNSIIDLRAGSSALELRNSMNKIESAVKTVDAAGEPARMTFRIDLPDGVKDAELRDHALIYNYSTSAGTSQVSRTFNTTLDGELPDDPGGYEITVYAEDGKVVIEVV